MSKTILVTGATAGIGYATTELLLQNGYKVWAVGRRTEKLASLKKKYGSRCLTAQMDVTDSESVKKFFKKNKPEIIDVLVNNAGLALGTTRAQDAAMTDWQTMIDTNITGLMRVTSFVLPAFTKKSKGHIVNLGSVAGKWAYPGGAVYCATKAAVKLFSEGLRMDLMGTHVRVTNIEPGMVETEFSIVRLKSKDKAAQVYAGMKPLTAYDIAESILWCIERPAHVNVSALTIFPTDQAGVGAQYINRK